MEGSRRPETLAVGPLSMVRERPMTPYGFRCEALGEPVPVRPRTLSALSARAWPRAAGASSFAHDSAFARDLGLQPLDVEILVHTYTCVCVCMVRAQAPRGCATMARACVCGCVYFRVFEREVLVDLEGLGDHRYGPCVHDL